MAVDPTPSIRSLIARSRALGSDPRNTNYGGGNTSVKDDAEDPATGEALEVMWIKGSGGDLGTLTTDGLAGLDLHRVHALEKTYRGPEDEDEIHRKLRHCAFGSGAAPSIDTTMHALIASPHVDHLHPDSVIAFATARDGEKLVEDCFEGEVGWIPWMRPGFELALVVRDLIETNPDLKGVVLGGHGLTTWGSTSEECQARSLDLIERASTFIEKQRTEDPFGGPRPGYEPSAEAERRDRAVALFPTLRGLASTDRAMIGHWRDDEVVLEFLASKKAPDLVQLGTSCPDHLIRTKVRPLLIDLPSDTPVGELTDRAVELHDEYRTEYTEYYERFADESTPPMRGADPAIFLVPGVGMFSFGVDAQTARVAGEFYVNAINVMMGAETISSYEPISDAEKFRVEYWDLEEEKLRRRPPPRALSGRVAVVTGAASGIGKAVASRLHGEGAVVALVDLNGDGARETAGALGDSDTALAVEADVVSEEAVMEAIATVVSRFGGVDILVNNAGLSASSPLVETSIEDWDRQHDVMARGSFLMAKHAVKAMVSQGSGGDIIYVASKNALVGGPNNIAYGSAKASQAHQVRLLAAELGSSGIRVNGVNPDGVVQGSGLFEGEWGRRRADVHGVDRDDLGKFYANRTLLKEEVLPDHVAAAVFVLVGGELSRSTGQLIAVDGGLPAAFPR